MKKYIITTLISLISVCGFAKTIEQLQTELPVYQDNVSVRTERENYIKANKTDFIAAFEKWQNVITDKNATKEQLAECQKYITTIMAVYYWLHDEMKVKDIVAIKIWPQVFFELNPNKYQEIKENKFVIDDTQLTPVQIFNIALINGDDDTILAFESQLSSFNANLLKNNINYIKKLILNMSDIKKAKSFCTSYERAMLIQGVPTDSPEYLAIKAFGKYLTDRLLESKITGE